MRLIVLTLVLALAGCDGPSPEVEVSDDLYESLQKLGKRIPFPGLGVGVSISKFIASDIYEAVHTLDDGYIGVIVDGQEPVIRVKPRYN